MRHNVPSSLTVASDLLSSIDVKTSCSKDSFSSHPNLKRCRTSHVNNIKKTTIPIMSVIKVIKGISVTVHKPETLLNQTTEDISVTVSEEF